MRRTILTATLVGASLTPTFGQTPDWAVATQVREEAAVVEGEVIELTVQSLEPCRVQVFAKSDGTIAAMLALPANTGGTASTFFRAPEPDLIVRVESFANCTYSLVPAESA